LKVELLLSVVGEEAESDKGEEEEEEESGAGVPKNYQHQLQLFKPLPSLYLSFLLPKKEIEQRTFNYLIIL
jgi:hypothetical protein